MAVPVRSLGAVVRCPEAWQITVEQCGNNSILVGNAAGMPGNDSYYLLFDDSYNSSIKFLFTSMYICFYLHTCFLEELQAVFKSNSRYA
jgi:hypothetical protein